MKTLRAFLVLFCIVALTTDIPAFPQLTAAAAAPAKKRSAKKKTSAKKAPAESSETPTKAVSSPKKAARTPVVRGGEILQLKAKKDGETKLYGFENVGDKYYWWAEAHALGKGKEQMNLGIKTQWVISPQYDRVAKEFSEGLAAVELNGKVGFIDRQNRYIIPPDFEPVDDLDGFHFGLAAAKKNGKYGFIDKKGRWVIEPCFDGAENFGDDYLAVVKRGSKFGCIDLTGDSVVPCSYIAKEMMKTLPGKNKPYREAKKRAKERWEQGFYKASLVEVSATADDVDKLIYNHNYIEPRGSVVPQGATDVGDGLYVITNSMGLMGATDSYGRRLIDCTNQKVTYDAVQRLFLVEKSITTPEDYRYTGVGIASTAGGWIIPPVFDAVGPFNPAGNATATVGDLTGTVNVHGLVDEHFLQHLLEESVKEKGTNYTRHLLGILPTCAAAHNCLGIYYASECDNLRDAIHHFTVAHNLEPDNEDFKANMKAAKSTRNNRRWNRVLNGMTIAATVLTVGAVTYSAAKGQPIDASSFNTSGYDSGSFSGTATESTVAAVRSSSGVKSSGSAINGKCPRCQGSGRCSIKTYSQRKRACSGSGLCGYCNGTGWIHAGGDRADCPNCVDGKCATCRGTGKCPDCGGSGKK
ncbi:MAG: WG repeat-containing protein [Firmicutes bacterium]|nr:WG repeat-containing protein [Bacillota bacterium]MCM1401948.1 WG repeat-containing protein [Bacteroides sp.]